MSLKIIIICVIIWLLAHVAMLFTFMPCGFDDDLSGGRKAGTGRQYGQFYASFVIADALLVSSSSFVFYLRERERGHVYIGLGFGVTLVLNPHWKKKTTFPNHHLNSNPKTLS